MIRKDTHFNEKSTEVRKQESWCGGVRGALGTSIGLASCHDLSATHAACSGRDDRFCRLSKQC